ncbi:hypothetical protein LTSEJOH_3061, partial [Salmonella enterica subsp. enterica serovar Johannesburg str. S5-703]
MPSTVQDFQSTLAQSRRHLMPAGVYFLRDRAAK